MQGFRHVQSYSEPIKKLPKYLIEICLHMTKILHLEHKHLKLLFLFLNPPSDELGGLNLVEQPAKAGRVGS
jgi:hypothetical protein